MKIAVLGAGMVGRAIAIDLAKKFEVTSIDLSQDSLDLLSKKAPGIQTHQANLSHFHTIHSLVKPFDLVVTAVPGFMGFEVLKHVILAGKNLVDISFFPEDALQLDALAKEKGVTAIVDCGVAPGVSNLVLGRYNGLMKINSFECFVGGLPKSRKKPFEYKAPFSPVDVIEEYMREARYVENGHIVYKPALSDCELIDFEEIGTLEAFNTDGLRSILYTMPHIPNMKEKTLRYPGHVDLIIALKSAGFFNADPVKIRGEEISPREFSSRILFKEWKLEENEEEFTIMLIRVCGEENGRQKTVEYFLIDRFNAATGTSSMARTTGYTCTAAVNMLADGLFNEKGVFPPELVGKHAACFEYILHYLAERNIIYRKTESNS